MNKAQGEISPDVQQSVRGNNEFAIDLYSQLKSDGVGDLFLSPSSISLALAMAYAGAAEETASEIAKTMHFSLPSDRLHESLRGLQDETKTGGVDFRIANRMWGQRGYNFLGEFLRTTEQCYGARLAEADFINASEATRIEINDWVAQRTNQRIKNLIPPNCLGEMTRLVLVNAVYFLGSWENEFKTEATVDAEFHVAPNQVQSVRMMRQTDSFRYGEFDDLQVLEMPYRSEQIEWKTVKHGEIEREEPVEVSDSGSDFVMTILLPRRVDGISDIENRLSVSTLQKWTTLSLDRVSVRFPRFRMESSYFLSEVLQALGMKKAFLIDQANFAGMSDNPEGLFIGETIHKAFVDVNEKGTEAAAATAIVMRGGSAMEPKPPKQFVVDHPFLFLIRDQRTQQIHFMGRVSSPSSQD